MSSVAVVKSIVGQVFAVSPEGIRRLLVEGDRLFAGEQVDTGASGAVSLELADGRVIDLSYTAALRLGVLGGVALAGPGRPLLMDGALSLFRRVE